MPNGGHICCTECGFSDYQSGKCTIYGTHISPGLLCRHFTFYGETRLQAHDKWPMLVDLEPGVSYQVDNDIYKSGNPRPKYRLVVEEIR